ncbi:hypothetical protein [Streptomyces sp. NPDC055140]
MPSKTAQTMNQIIRGTQPEPTVGDRKTADIHTLYKRGLQQIRGDRNMHPDRKRVEAARLYTTTKASLAKVRKAQAVEDETTFTKLERKLWGYDLERATAIDRATLDTTIRDAQDRAAKLTKPDHAARALRDAEQAGDHILARAIGKRAHDRDWGDVLHDYLGARPSAAADYEQAGSIWHRRNSTNARMQHSMQYVVHKPEELRGLADQDVEAMATDQADATA